MTLEFGRYVEENRLREQDIVRGNVVPLPQIGLAERMGVSAKTIRNIESGKDGLFPDTAIKLKDALYELPHEKHARLFLLSQNFPVEIVDFVLNHGRPFKIYHVSILDIEERQLSDRITFPLLFTRYRKDMSMSHVEFADAIDVSVDHVFKIQRGVKHFGPQKLIDSSRVLQIARSEQASYFLSGRGFDTHIIINALKPLNP